MGLGLGVEQGCGAQTARRRACEPCASGGLPRRVWKKTLVARRRLLQGVQQGGAHFGQICHEICLRQVPAEVGAGQEQAQGSPMQASAILAASRSGES